MPTFSFEATHDDGRTVRGTEFGTSATAVVQALALKGLLVQKIEPVGSFDPIPTDFVPGQPVRPIERPVQAQPTPVSQPRLAETEVEGNPRPWAAVHLWGPMMGGVPLESLVQFYRQLAAMQNAGVPLYTALETISKQSTSARLGGVILEMARNAQDGKPISDVMQRYPEVFGALQVSLVRSGEEGGFLHRALILNSEYIDADIQLRNLYRRETAYPKMVIIASIVIISAANAIIQAIGGKSGVYSPLTDPAIVVFLIPLLVGTFLFRRIGLNIPRVRYNWDMILLKIPYLGHTLHQFSMAKFGRALGALMKGGVSVPRALKLAADSCGNEYIRSMIYPAATKIEDGSGIADTLRGTQVFTPLVLDMLSTGEASGSVDDMLNKVSDYYESEAAVRAQLMGRVTGVVALIVVGIYVGFVVISFFLGAAAQITNEVNR